jgi:acyl-[acyl-carrier-protein]-phospholipid O-acyltransferase/long-chain-fatty-acid--[acyl-carrier-protein] ligase
MTLAVGAILGQNLYLIFLVLALMGAQSALFGPSKMGSIPEMLPPQKISMANGWMGLVTVVATLVGVVAGNQLYAATVPKGLTNTWICAATLIGTAVIGTLTSLLIARLPSARPDLKFPSNPLVQTWRDLQALTANKALLRVALGIAFFWSLGALAQSNILEFVREGQLEQPYSSPLLAALVVGVGLGSVLAGVWSGGRVELGILPLGAGGVAISSMLLFTVDGNLAAGGAGWSGSFLLAGFFLFLLGISAGLFDIPLNAYMQHRSPAEQRGVILAASNFLTFAGMLLSAGVYYLVRLPGADGLPRFSAREVFLLAGLFTIPVFLYIVFLLPQASIRFLVWLASKTAYRVRVYGHENLPERGGALLVCNHVTWIDGVLLLMASSRPIRMLAHADYISSWPIRWLARMWGVIPIEPGKQSVRHSLETARQALRDGALVCIFPEGGLSRTGQMQAFKPGLMSLVRETGVPVIPVFLDELWGSIFSFAGGRYFWKWPKRWPYPVSIHFGQAVEQPDEVHFVRQAVEELGVSAVQLRYQRQMVLPRMFLRMCRRTFFQPKVADSTGVQLTGGKLLIGALALKRALENKLLTADEKYVGLLLPPSVGAVVTNIALPLAGRIGVNLNYTVSSEVMNSCIRQCGIRRVLTSRKVMEKLNLQLDAEVVYLDEWKTNVGRLDKLIASLQATLLPIYVLERWLGLMKIKGSDPITVIFTSGSTGEPKGVVLSQHNVGSNIEAMDQLVNLRPDDVAIGVLPFFHSYGYTATLWTVLAFDPLGVFHFSPLDASQVAKLCKKHKGTLLMTTPTFLRNYLRRSEKEDYSSLEVVFASAEKLPADLSDAFEAKFGVRPMEAYGATELSPLVSVNVPASRTPDPSHVMSREGSVGRPIPGVMAKIIDPETGRALGVDTPGMLLIKGPNVMQGYLHRPDLTEKVIRDGWYVTGDMARLDADGFLFITGRQSRFSKIGGEMVPHIKIEETLQRILSADAEELKAVVTAVPDSRRGERLVVLHKAIEKTPQQLCKELQAAGLPNIWIPSPDSFCEVQDIPVLGTGKLDLKGMKDLALEKFAEEPVAG